MSTEPEPTPSTPAQPTAPTPTDPPSLASGTEPNAPAPGEPPKEGEPAKVEPPAPVEPLTMEAIKLPEGFTVDEETSKNFLEAMNDDKLSPAERAQKLVDIQTTLLQKASEANYAAWTDMQTQWQDQVRADPEIGGDKLAPVLGGISKLVDQYGSPELRQVMDTTGAGNHPVMIKFLHNIAKDLSEGGPVSGAPALAKETLADRMYPSMKPKQGA